MHPIPQFAALADVTRCTMLEMLHERPRPVHELAEAFDISRPAISRHLKVLKDAGLVREEKRGRENVYALQRAELDGIHRWLNGFWVSRLARTSAKAVDRPARSVPADLFAFEALSP